MLVPLLAHDADFYSFGHLPRGDHDAGLGAGDILPEVLRQQIRRFLYHHLELWMCMRGEGDGGERGTVEIRLRAPRGAAIEVGSVCIAQLAKMAIFPSGAIKMPNPYVFPGFPQCSGISRVYACTSPGSAQEQKVAS